jgi:hypothetical protein
MQLANNGAPALCSSHQSVYTIILLNAIVVIFALASIVNMQRADARKVAAK